jgi:hypothetical protein
VLKSVVIAFLIVDSLALSYVSASQKFSYFETAQSDDTIHFVTKTPLGADSVSVKFNNYSNRHKYYAQKKNEILLEFNRIDSLELWHMQGEIVDPDSTWSTLEGSGWVYLVNDSMEFYQYGLFGESQRIIKSYYIKNKILIMHREVNTKYNV